METFEMLIAVDELKKFENQVISVEDIIAWRINYVDLFNTFDWDESNVKEHLFHNYFLQVNTIYDFLIHNECAIDAIEAYKDLDNEEIALLKWLVEYEWLYYIVINLPGDTIEQEALETGLQPIVKDFNISISIDILKESLDFYHLYQPIYHEMFYKYLTISKEDYFNLDIFGEEYEKFSSLKYNLEQRGII